MTATAPSPADSGQSSSDGGMRVVYWVLAAILVVLVVVGLITYGAKEQDEQAQQIAAELTQKFEAAGLTVPADQEMIERSFGNDGGAVCANPANALGQAVMHDMMANGASFVGRRPVIVDRSLIVGEALILETYCPEELQAFRDKFNDFKFDDTIKN